MRYRRTWVPDPKRMKPPKNKPEVLSFAELGKLFDKLDPDKIRRREVEHYAIF